MTQRSFLLALALALPLAAGTASAGLARGPSTPEERERVVALVEVLESQPASPQAVEGRSWLLGFLGEVPDLTVKQCLSLLGPPAMRAGIRPELLQQQLFSSAAYMLRTPGAGAGDTVTLAAGLAGTLKAYRAWKQADPAVAHARLDQLIAIEERGELTPYVRAASRGCR